MAKTQLIELSTTSLQALVGAIAFEQPLNLSREILVPALAALGGTIAGALIAFKIELWEKGRIQKKEMSNKIFLIREDLRKCQGLLRESLIRMSEASKTVIRTRALLSELPTSYLENFNYVDFFGLIGQDGVDHIRNIRTYVIPRWNETIKSSYPQEDLEKLAYYTSDCLETVIAYLEKTVPAIGKTKRAD